MSNMNITPSSPSEAPATIPANGNDLRVIDTSLPTPSADAVVPKARTIADLEKLDDATRTRLGSDWADRCQKAGVDFQDLDARRDSYLQRAIAALALSIALFPDTDWAAKVNALQIGAANIKSKHKAAMAVVGTFALNPHQADKAKAKLDGQALDRNALATEWLANHVAELDDSAKATLTLDDAGIDYLTNVLLANGGIRTVGEMQRAENRNAAEASRLRLAIHKKGAASIVEERGEQHLRTQYGLAMGAPVPFTVEVKVGGAQTAYTVPAELVAAIQASVYESVAGVDPLVDALGEIMKVSTVVPHQLAGAAAMAAPEMGAGSRQVVLRADQSVQISTMPGSRANGPVLIARPVAKTIEPWPTVSCRMVSEGWQFAEANLIDTDRRKYFKASVQVDAGAAASITLTTATGAETPAEETIALEPLVSGRTAYPVEFDKASFSADFVLEVDAPDLTEWRTEAASKLRIAENHVKLVASGASASFKIGKHTLSAPQTGPTMAGEVYLRPIDFVALAKAIDGLVLAGSGKVSFEIDQDLAMRITFETSLAAYELYVPVVQAGSLQPLTHGFRQMTVA